MARDQVEQLVAAVRAGARYRAVDAALVRAVGAKVLRHQPNLPAAVKHTRNKLHQAAGVYRDRRFDAAAALALLHAGDRRAACAALMAQHASTRERLPHLDRFYADVLADIGPIHSVADLGCGLHPLAIPWLPFAPDCRYAAYDVFDDLIGFLNEALPLLGVDGAAHTLDLSQEAPSESVDVAFLLKLLPCLDQLDPGASARLLDALQARVLIISYPAAGLSGRSRGMPAHYAAQFARLAAGRPWQVRRFDFPTELVFVVRMEG